MPILQKPSYLKTGYIRWDNIIQIQRKNGLEEDPIDFTEDKKMYRQIQSKYSKSKRIKG